MNSREPVFTRFTRSYLNSYGIIKGLSERDELMTNRVVALVMLGFQYPIMEENLFGEKILLPELVSKVFGYNEQYLKNKHPDPLFFQLEASGELDRKELVRLDELAGKLEPGGAVGWLTNLDNALYAAYLNTRNSKTSQRQTVDQQSKTLEQYGFLENVALFKELSKVYINRKRQLMYRYKEDERFLKSQGRDFLFVDFNLFRKLTLRELKLYLFLIKTRGNTRFTFKKNNPQVKYPTVVAQDNDLAYLCFKADMDLMETKGKSLYQMQRIRISQTIESINAKAGYTFCELGWMKFKEHHRFEAHPRLEFPYSEREKETMESGFNERIQQFGVYFLKERFRAFTKGRLPDSMESFHKGFIDYLYKKEVDSYGKRDAIFTAFQFTTDTVPEAIERDPLTYSQRLIETAVEVTKRKLPAHVAQLLEPDPVSSSEQETE